MLLIDASVWVLVADHRDPHHEATLAIVRDQARPLGALDLTIYEIANVIGAKWGKVTEAGLIAQLMLTRCDDRIVRVDAELLEAALAVSAEHGLTAYDAAYVAAARRHGMTLVSTDFADLVSKGLAVTPADALYP